MASGTRRPRFNAKDTFKVDAKHQTFEASGEGMRHIGLGLIALAAMRLRIPAFCGLLLLLVTRYGPDLAALGFQLVRQ